MISAATIAGLEAQGIDYILGVRERTLREIRQTVLEDDGVAVPLFIHRQKGETDLAVKNVEVAGRRYVVCRNSTLVCPWRARCRLPSRDRSRICAPCFPRSCPRIAPTADLPLSLPVAPA